MLLRVGNLFSVLLIFIVFVLIKFLLLIIVIGVGVIVFLCKICELVIFIWLIDFIFLLVVNDWFEIVSVDEYRVSLMLVFKRLFFIIILFVILLFYFWVGC